MFPECNSEWRLAIALAIGLVGCAVASGLHAQTPRVASPEALIDKSLVDDTTPDETTPDETPDETKRAAVSPLYERMKGQVEPIGPDTFILLDEQGNPKKILGMSYEEFFAAWKKQQAIAAEAQESPKVFSLDELRIFGSLESNYARLTATFFYRIDRAGRVEVPLRLGNTFPQRVIESPGQSSRQTLGYSAERKEYFVAMRAKPGETVRVQVELIAPVHRDGSRANLRLLVPRATKSSLELASKEVIEKVVASKGIVLSSKPMAGGGRRVKAIGMNDGEFVLSWEEPRRTADPLAPLLGATGKLFSTIDGQSVRTQAQIKVQSFGGPFREFKIWLPPGAQRIPQQPSAPFESVVEDPAGAEGAGAEGRGTLLLVRLTEETKGPVILKLKTDQPVGVPTLSSPVELAGFEVEGAVRQYGEIGVLMDDQWQLRWKLNDSVEQVSPSEIDRSWQTPRPKADDISTALRYSRQPWSLPVQLLRRQRRDVARPMYLLTIHPGEAILEMQVDYQISGVRNFPVHFPLAFALEGWTVEEHLTSGLENTEESEETDRTAEEKSGESSGEGRPGGTIEFRSASAILQRPSIELRMRRRLPMGKGAEAEILELPLPYLYSNQDRMAIDHGDLLVKVDSSLLLKPALARSIGLAPQAVERSTQLEGSDPAGQRFRYRGLQSRMQFAATRKLRPQRMEIAIQSRVTLDRDRLAVVQDFDYDVRHQKIDSVLLRVPGELLQQQDLELALLAQPSGDDEMPALETPLDYPLETGGGMMPVELRIGLPHPQIGKFRIRARYSQPRPENLKEGTYVLPLVSSVEGDLLRHRLTLPSVEGQALLPAEGPHWQVEKDPSGSTDLVTLLTRRPTNFLPLVRSPEPQREGNLTLQRVWMQTWLTPSVTQERVVFQFLGGGQTVYVELLPHMIDGESMEVTIDGKTMQGLPVVNKGSLEVEVAGDRSIVQHTLELRYRRQRRLGATESLRLERPRLRGNGGLPEIDWQIVVPVEYSLVHRSEGLVKAFRLQWEAGQWRAKPESDTAKLEDQVGARRRMAPTRGEQAYLFRSLDPSAPLEAIFVRRELLILAVSATVLALCLALWYVPFLRRPPVVLSGLVALALVGLAFPEASVLFGQAGILGAICGGGGLWLALLAKRSRPPVPLAHPPTGAASSVVSAGTKDSTVLQIGADAASSDAPTHSANQTDPS